MALVVVVTSDVADRFRGFLASVMLEVSAGVYVAPRMNKGVRERTWSVLADWHGHEPRGSVVMVWRDLDAVGGIGIANLGAPPRELVDVGCMSCGVSWPGRGGVWFFENLDFEKGWVWWFFFLNQGVMG